MDAPRPRQAAPVTGEDSGGSTTAVGDRYVTDLVALLGIVARVGELCLGDATVKAHVANLLHKLGLRDRVQAVVYACEHGLVEPGVPHPRIDTRD